MFVLQMFEEILKQYFSNLGVALTKSFSRYTSGVVSACSFSTHEIARHVSQATGLDFNTSEKGLKYLLDNDKFQIDDRYWRQHIGMVFDLMEEQDLIKKGDVIYLQVDFTSNENFFLILSASMIVNNRSVPLYFTMRNYPQRKNQYNHKKMEEAFLKGLKHALSKKFTYVILADRGFGNNRFLSLCEQVGFDYLIRITPNMKVKCNEKEGVMDSLCSMDGAYNVKIVEWDRAVAAYRASSEKGAWYLLSSMAYLNEVEAANIYKDRFKIEKCFQDLKSAGFNMEKSKIKKYSRYKRLLAMAMAAHALLVMLGHVISVKLPHFLKNSALMAGAILAFFLSEKRLSPYLQKDSSAE